MGHCTPTKIEPQFLAFDDINMLGYNKQSNIGNHDKIHQSYLSDRQI